MAENQILV